jgi:hypothetical protein
MTRPSISIFLLVVGLLWAAIVLWFLVATGSMVADIRGTLLSYSWLFIGPLLLIVGAVLSLGTHHRAGSILLLIGCAILTVTVGYQSISMLKGFADPLIPNPHYGIWAVGVILTLLSDVGAVQLYRWK